MKDYTKISINKDLHKLVKDICDREGIKMYFLEDQAIKDYVAKNYPRYIENGYRKLFEQTNE